MKFSIFKRIRLSDAFAIHNSINKEESLTKEMNEMRKERPVTTQKKRNLLEQIKVYVDAHLQENITLKSVAAHCGVSVSTVTQLFQKHANMTFHSFVTMRRMKLAEELIVAGVALEQVGKQAGYQDHSTFYRAFRQYYGKAPREFRNELVNKNQ